MEQKTRIKGNVHYVGVNDRNKHRFEALWPLPYGVSYNSYLIDDEMVALVDTVDICYFEVYLRKIKQVIVERPINYLIINPVSYTHRDVYKRQIHAYIDLSSLSNRKLIFFSSAIKRKLIITFSRSGIRSVFSTSTDVYKRQVQVLQTMLIRVYVTAISCFVTLMLPRFRRIPKIRQKGRPSFYVPCSCLIWFVCMVAYLL